jgi:hypothetical protein
MGAISINEVTQPVIGRFYVVPTVFNAGWKINVPIYGPPHNDKEYLDFEEEHYHVDWRFVGNRFYRYRLSTRFATDCDPSYFLHGIVTCLKFGNEVRPMRLRMKRETPSYPPPDKIPWLKKLENAYNFHRLPKCRTCPHKGISLCHVKPDNNGLITCPGHGLTWHSVTGALVRGT